MIIWEGWALPIVLVSMLAGGFTGSLVAQATGHTKPGKWEIPNGAFLAIAVLFAVAGCLSFFLGRWLNIVRARTKVEEYVEFVREDLTNKIRSGTFEIAPGIVPRVPDASAYIDEVAEQQRKIAQKAMKNQHSLFFVPVQYIGIFFLGVSVLSAISAINEALGS